MARTLCDNGDNNNEQLFYETEDGGKNDFVMIV